MLGMTKDRDYFVSNTVETEIDRGSDNCSINIPK